MVTNEQIQEIKNIIVETVQPKAIYLIGSYVNGKASEKSDLDFLIISDNKEVPRYERTAPILKKLFHFPQIPIDLMLFTEEEVNKRKDNPLTFIGDALKNGRLIYGRS